MKRTLPHLKSVRLNRQSLTRNSSQSSRRMGKYNIEFKPSVWKDLDRVPQADRLRILKRIDELAVDPRSYGSEKVSGHKDRYRIRQGNDRILHSIEGDRVIVVVVKVGHGREVYDR